VSSVAPAVRGASDLVTNKRSIKTSVMVDDGKMVVLGGLIEDNLTEKVSKVPLLGDVPLVGSLFRSKSTTKGKTNLMVFIHPAIMRDDAIGAQYTSGKYNYIRNKQLERQREGVMLMPGEKQPELPAIEQMLQHKPATDAAAPAEKTYPAPAESAVPAPLQH